MKTIKPSTPLRPSSLLSFLVNLYPSTEGVGSEPEEISAVCPPESSEASNSSLSFLRTSDSHQIAKSIRSSNSGVFLVSDKAQLAEIPNSKWILQVPNPHVAYIQIMEEFFLDREETFLPQNIHSTAIIDGTAKIGENVRVGAYVVIGANVEVERDVVIHPHVVLYHNVKVGRGSTLHAHVIIREHCVIGNECCVQPGAVIGSDGFGYVQDPKVGLRAVPQVGSVNVADRVDLGSNTCVDRAAAGVTNIGMGTKIDNLVQIGHNVEVGAHSVICGQVGIGGSSKIGEGVVLGGKVGVGDHMKISSGVRIGGAGIVISHVEEPGDYMGYPVQPASKWRRSLVAQLQLPELLKTFKKKQ